MSAFNEDISMKEDAISSGNSGSRVNTHGQSTSTFVSYNPKDNGAASESRSMGKQLVVSEIDRSHRQLTDIPVISAQEAGGIRSLHLQRNVIARLPATIAMYSKLQYLDVSNNAMHSLPQELCQLDRLQTFIARNNQLTDGRLP